MGWAMRTRFVVSGGWCQTKRRRELPSQRFPVFAAPTVVLTLSAASLPPLLPSAAVSVLTSTRARTWVSPSAFLSGSASTWFCFPPRCVFPYPTSVRDGYLHAPSGLTKGLTLSLLSLQTYCRYLCWYSTERVGAAQHRHRHRGPVLPGLPKKVTWDPRGGEKQMVRSLPWYRAHTSDAPPGTGYITTSVHHTTARLPVAHQPTT